MALRSSNVSNFLLADGHVKWLHPSAASPSCSAAAATYDQDQDPAGSSNAAGTAALTSNGAHFAATFSTN